MATRGRRNARAHGASVKRFPPAPEALVADIDAAVASFENARPASLAVHLAFPSSQGEAAEKTTLDDWDRPAETAPVYDKQVADEAYKAACSALASGNTRATPSRRSSSQQQR